MKKNKHGLSRDIPASVTRQIRQECGFGCIVCGCGIHQYEHIDPTFIEAKEHDPKKMALLCGRCHCNVTKGIWSKEKIKSSRNNPKCFEIGFSNNQFDIGSQCPLEVVLAETRFVDMGTILQYYDEPLLKIEKPISPGEPYRLSGFFCDRNGMEIFRIDENEWKGNIENWDIEIVSNTITIYREHHKIALKLKVEPPSKIIIEQIDMYYKGCHINGKLGDKVCIETPLGIKQKLIDVEFGHYKKGVTIKDNGFDLPSGGGEGCYAQFGNMTIGNVVGNNEC